MNQSLTASPPDVWSIKADIHSHRRSVGPKRCMPNYPSQRAMDLNSKKAPHHAWLIVLPFHDFHLHEYCYGNSGMLYTSLIWLDFAQHCVCGESFPPDHAMICHHGGLTFVHHNEIRVITAKWLDSICHDVVAKPPLKPLTGENVVPATANWQYDTIQS